MFKIVCFMYLIVSMWNVELVRGLTGLVHLRFDIIDSVKKKFIVYACMYTCIYHIHTYTKCT